MLLAGLAFCHLVCVSVRLRRFLGHLQYRKPARNLKLVMLTVHWIVDAQAIEIS